jgi:hypothetical protein
MIYREGPPLRSQFLLDIKAGFLMGTRLWVGRLEFEEVGGDRLAEEALSVVLKTSIRELRLYQQLVVWGDQIAVFGVRENVRKRMDRRLLRVGEFVLNAEPSRMVETYQWSESQVCLLDAPPGPCETDRKRLEAIELRWLALSTDGTQ